MGRLKGVASLPSGLSEFPMIPPQVNGATTKRTDKSVWLKHEVSNDSAPS